MSAAIIGCDAPIALVAIWHLDIQAGVWKVPVSGAAVGVAMCLIGLGVARLVRMRPANAVVFGLQGSMGNVFAAARRAVFSHALDPSQPVSKIARDSAIGDVDGISSTLGDLGPGRGTACRSARVRRLQTRVRVVRRRARCPSEQLAQARAWITHCLGRCQPPGTSVPFDIRFSAFVIPPCGGPFR